MDYTERIQVASADNVLEFQEQLNFLYERGYRLLSQSTAGIVDRIIFTAVLEKEDGVATEPVFEETLSRVETEHEIEQAELQEGYNE
jgi:hypothetical protein